MNTVKGSTMSDFPPPNRPMHPKPTGTPQDEAAWSAPIPKTVKKPNKADEDKRTKLREMLSGEKVVLEFAASMVHPKMTTGIQQTRTSVGAVSKSSPALCWITETRLLIAFKNVHAEGRKMRDMAKMLAEPVNIFITPLGEIYDIQLTKFFKSNGMTITTRNSIYQFVGTAPSPTDLIPYLKDAKTPTSVPESSLSVDVPTQIRKFAELRDQGLITEEEFQVQKTKLLS